MRRAGFAAATLAFAGLVALVAYVKAQGIPPAELARRCAACRPTWQSYEEEIKTIGAAPVAAWQGEPVHLERTRGAVRLRFRLSGPWIDYEAALPVLLRDPLGSVYCSAVAEGSGAERTYVFELSKASATVALPWIEVRYPHTETRLPLDAAGNWARSPN